MNIFQNHDIRLRTLELEDAALLVNWLSDPQVLAYYEGRDRSQDMASILEHQYKAKEIG
ncbi:GNAT family protein [Paenibacillus roseipurpureus]|uniref:Uncharacterized protein n=1 Tax=Paenibacillus roseopurpureus TaxID=2918901 RepID=A0AA96LT93_9BACL|nr:hypothetical protein [Paenibacillus sp. MBLB1832]WNR46752.1 hypothetical protein MJB10_11865 [Paenibacillus sp. MBLB1832]